MVTQCPPAPPCCESGEYSLDKCGCCPVCARAELERCGGAEDVLGRCGAGLQCLKTCSESLPLLPSLSLTNPLSPLQSPAGQSAPVGSPASSPSSTAMRLTGAAPPGTWSPASRAPPRWTQRAGWWTWPGATVTEAVPAPASPAMRSSSLYRRGNVLTSRSLALYLTGWEPRL